MGWHLSKHGSRWGTYYSTAIWEWSVREQGVWQKEPRNSALSPPGWIKGNPWAICEEDRWKRTFQRDRWGLCGVQVVQGSGQSPGVSGLPRTWSTLWAWPHSREHFTYLHGFTGANWPSLQLPLIQESFSPVLGSTTPRNLALGIRAWFFNTLERTQISVLTILDDSKVEKLESLCTYCFLKGTVSKLAVNSVSI